MRAIVLDSFGDENVMHMADIESPALTPTDVRIRVRATSVNRADLLQRRGLYPPPKGASEILGLECTGDIIEIGDEVREFNVGQRVMALLAGGGYAEEVVVDAGSVIAVPEGMTNEQAAGFMETFLTAYFNLFVLAHIERGQSALIHGGGSGVGTSALKLCAEAGVRSFCTAGGKEKTELCIKHGAQVAIDYKAEDFVEIVRAETNKRGVDAILDCIGASYLTRNIDCLARNGRLVLIGLLGGTKSEINLATLLNKRLTIIGSTLRSKTSAEKREIVTSFVSTFGEALTQLRLLPVVHEVLPLEKVADAHRLIQASRHFGKVILEVAS